MHTWLEQIRQDMGVKSRQTGGSGYWCESGDRLWASRQVEVSEGGEARGEGGELSRLNKVVSGCLSLACRRMRGMRY